MSSTPTKAIDFTVQIIVEPDQGGFYAYCPALKGLHVDGETEEEALQNARDAAILYLRSLIKHGDPIPKRWLDMGRGQGFNNCLSAP
ncbi:MAG: type II toxin-antitoxin system HicB family antitoxin [Dehalococcoidia bacterium]